MTDRYILCTGAEVRAILAGQKTQLRRPVGGMVVRGRAGIIGLPGPERQPTLDDDGVWRGGLWARACPFGLVGGTVLVKEAWQYAPDGIIYRADGPAMSDSWRSATHMPREACRLHLSITNIRVQQIQDISDEDVQAEGRGRLFGPGTFFRAIDSWWDGKREDGGLGMQASWRSNPWVWALTFTAKPALGRAAKGSDSK